MVGNCMEQVPNSKVFCILFWTLLFGTLLSDFLLFGALSPGPLPGTQSSYSLDPGVEFPAVYIQYVTHIGYCFLNFSIQFCVQFAAIFIILSVS